MTKFHRHSLERLPPSYFLRRAKIFFPSSDTIQMVSDRRELIHSEGRLFQEAHPLFRGFVSLLRVGGKKLACIF